MNLAGVAVAVLLVLGSAWRLGWNWDLAAYLYFAAISVLLSFADLRTHRLPNRLTLTAYPALLVLLAVPAVAQAQFGSYLRAVLAGLVLFAVFLSLHVVNPAGMGVGDVKLAGSMGIALGWVSWSTVLTGTFAGFCLGAIGGIALIALRRARRTSALPFGPFMLAGAWAAILAGA